MKLKKDLDQYNKNELLDIVFSFVEEEDFEEKELKELLDLNEDELRVLVKNLMDIDEEIYEIDDDENDKEDEEDEEECDECCKCEEEVDKDDIEIMASQLALTEEMIRQENLYNKEFDVSEKTKNTELYQEMIIMAESVVAGLRVLIDGGIDYNNALQMCSNQIQNRQNLELAKYNCVVNQGQNQI